MRRPYPASFPGQTKYKARALCAFLTMPSTPAPEHQRTPRVPLSATELQQALDELDAKIQTLRNRAHATAAGSTATYQQHADALETKRARLAQQLTQAPAQPDNGTDDGVWTQIRRGVDALREDIKNLI